MTVSAARTAIAPGFSIRGADIEDLDALVAIEERSFGPDRLSRRSLRRLLARETAVILVAEQLARTPLGYALVLVRRDTALARLYSLAVDPAAAGQGFGEALLASAEQSAIERGSIAMRLEVRVDNTRAITFYERHGYREFGRLTKFFANGIDAIRMEKRLAPAAPLAANRVPYWAQTTGFTSGAASLMMALSHFRPEVTASRALEYRLWREATTIFMTSGPGGTDPFGMALALAHRGLDTEVVTNERGPVFLDTVRSPEKRAVMRIAQLDFRQEAASLGIPIRDETLHHGRLTEAIDDGAVAIVLISANRMVGTRVPHWILVHGHHHGYMIVHDPWVEPDVLETPTTTQDLPIPAAAFDRMARFGRARLRIGLIVRPPAGRP